MSIKLVLDAGCSLRGAAATLALLARERLLPLATPCYSTIRSWLLRVGHFALNQPLDTSVPWVWLLDHTIQVGSTKVLAIVGCPLERVPFGERSLRLADLQLIALAPMEKSNAATVQTELVRAAERTGVPRLIVSDQGSDLVKGVAEFQIAHPRTAHVPDVAHYGANLLEHAWDGDARWQEFVKHLQTTASKLRQTASAHLLAPRLRLKARFMNVAPQVRFAARLLGHLDGPAPCAKAVEHYGWLPGFRAEVARWLHEHDLVRTAIEVVRVDGLDLGTRARLEERWGEVGTSASTARIAGRLRAYVSRYRPKDEEDAYVGSTEVLESAFGRLKRIEGEQSQGGMTGLMLALGAMLGTWSEGELRAALEATPEKKAQGWAERVLGPTVQWLRKKLFAAPKA